MEDLTLIKDYTTPSGKEYKAGQKYAGCRDTYVRLLAEGICEPIKGDKKPKKKTKKTVEDGNIN